MDEVIVKADTVARMTFAGFAAFYDKTPPKERWELIDGEAIKMAPAKTYHHRIAKVIDQMLTVQLEMTQPDWYSDREVGVRDRSIDVYAPQPDITVRDRDYPIEQVWAERFYIVVEVQPDERPDVLAKKRLFYQSHAQCRGYMFVSQSEVTAALVTRQATGWQSLVLGANDHIHIPDIGTIGRLAQAYRDTPLRPKT